MKLTSARKSIAWKGFNSFMPSDEHPASRAFRPVWFMSRRLRTTTDITAQALWEFAREAD
jgi:hypothetical protein